MTRQYDIWHYPQKWMQIPSNKIQNIGEPRLQEIKERIKEYAKAETAYQRLRETEQVARKATHDANKQIFTIIVVIGGALTYGSVMMIFAANLGQLAVPAALVGGALASYGVDALAKNSLTNYFRAQILKKVIFKLIRLKGQEQAAQGQQFSELSSLFWDAKRALVE